MAYKDDRFYIDKVLEGDVVAFTDLVNKHKDMVFTLALRITGNREDAEEVAQDAFVKVYRSLGTFRHHAKFTTWLYRIVYNESISALRRKQPEMAPLGETMLENYSEDEIMTSVSALEEDEQQQLILNALDQLPPSDQALITLFYLDDRNVGEISEITGLSFSNVKVRLHRIRKKLYTILNGISVHSTT